MNLHEAAVKYCNQFHWLKVADEIDLFLQDDFFGQAFLYRFYPEGINAGF
jgi:hypothetical protein